MEPNELRQKWVAALRSGQYKQGDGYLCRKNKHCCLGVLCEIYSDNVKSLEITGTVSTEKRYNDNVDLPPVEVIRAVGITNTESGVLAQLNDNGLTFVEIAELIESNKICDHC